MAKTEEISITRNELRLKASDTTLLQENSQTICLKANLTVYNLLIDIMRHHNN